MNKRIIHTVFEKVVSTFPQNIAVEEENASITFKKLNNRANQIANLLRNLGLNREQVAATLLPSGINLISALLGIFKAGGIYMPMGTTMSEKRISQVLTKGDPRILIVSKDQKEWVLKLINTLKINIQHILVLEDDQPLLLSFDGPSLKEEILELHNFSDENLPVINESTDGNYIFYTSGSTGTPKAILGCHDSLSHFIHWEKNEFEIDDSCRVSQLTAITFDASLRDIFLPLCTGGTLCIPSESVKSNLLKLAEWLENSSVTLMHSVPSLFRSLTRILPEEKSGQKPFEKLKYIFLAGEMLYNKDIQNWRSKVGTHVQIVNFYGATESTMIKTFHRIGEVADNPAAIIPVGKPISNTVIAIINDSDTLCSAGEIGNVYIKTPFLSKGYYKDLQLTEKVFVQNPLVKDKKDILYYTGDLGRYMNSGEVEILGRKDNQVKVNGIRVELAEIEQAVLSLEGVLEAIVIPYINKENLTELICYFTGNAAKSEDFATLLQKELNQGTIPSYFFYLEEMPLNINGKIDKKKLPKPSKLLIDDNSFQPVEGAFEQKIEEIWKGVLGIERIGRNSSFFNIGGNSLKAIQMISRIYKEFNVMILVRDIFDAPTIAKLAVLLKEKAQGPSRKDIPSLPHQEYYDLSHAQRRLWVLNQYGQVGHAYNIHQAFVLRGTLDLSVFRKVLRNLILRHEVLRTTFHMVGEEPKQKIHDFDSFEFELTFLDCRNNTDEITIEEHLNAATKINFDLEKGPLINALLIQQEKELFIFSFTIHHIVGDAWSIEILINEVFQLYNAYSLKEANPLSPLKIQYKDFAAWQNSLFNNEGLDNSRDYWLNRLSGNLPILDLPTDYPRPITKTYNGDSVVKWMDEGLSQKLLAFSKDSQTSLFMVLLSTVNALLYRYTGQKDIVIGTPVAGRDHEGLENQVGFYINNLVLRTEIEALKSFRNLLNNVKRHTLDAFEHQAYPFDRLVEDLNIPRDTSRAPLFDVALVLLNTDIEKKGNKIEGLGIEGYPNTQSSSTMDIRMVFEKGPKGLFMMFEYNTDLFHKKTISSMMNHFVRLVDSAINYPEKEIVHLDYLTEEETKKWVYDVNNTAYTFEPACVHELFEKQAQATPEALAIVWGQNTWTYAEVNEQANHLAYYLRSECQVLPNDIVGLMTYTNEHAIISILAIMKAGAAYLPVDPDLPELRKGYMLSDAKIKLLLTEAALIVDLPADFNGDVFALDVQWEGLEEHPDNLPLINKVSDLAYVIYTSGSTGKPKGVCIAHESQVNMSTDQIRRFQITPKDNVLQFASLSFDASIYELFMTFYAGATLVLKDKSLVFETDSFVQYLQKMEVSIATLPPSFLSTLPLEKLQFLRVLVTAGEAAKVSDLSFLSKYMQCYNAYGPTECAVCVSTYQVTPEDKNRTAIPIGKPISNTQLYVLDHQLNPVPRGVTGMIYIAGKGLAKSYLHQNELTQKSFIDNPFDAGTKMYVTGDLGKWDSDGNLIFLGRADRQVKVNGFRIELGEIESFLMGHERIKDAFLTARRDISGKYKDIIAYYVAEEELSYAEIRGYLGQYLPDYMMPSYFMSIAELPLNNNGKVAEQLLPKPESDLVLESAYRQPQNQLQQTLVKLWEEILYKENVGIDDNFFELGGHSLKATQILASINDTYNIRLGLSDFFRKPTIAALSELIDNMETGTSDRILPVSKQNHYETTNAQRRLWVLHQFEGDQTAYNLPVILEVKGSLNIEALSEAFLALVKCHESLRTTFRLVEGVLKQKIHPVEEFSLPFEHIKLAENEANSDLITQIKDNLAKQIFDLEEGPLLKAVLVSLEKNRYILTFNIHHIISDEWSMAILVEEWLALYRTIHQGVKSTLGDLNIQYKDFAAWQNSQINAPEWSEHKAYWTKQFQEPVPKLDLPTTHIRPEVKSTKGDAANIVLDSELVQQLLTLGKSESTSMFMCLCASVYAFLYRYTGQKDVVIGTPVTLRDKQELQGQVGLYLNLLALRMELNPEDSFVGLLRNTNNDILNAFKHQAYPFDQLVEDLALPRDTSRSPLFDVLVVVHDKASENRAMPEIEGLEINAVNTGTTISRYDLTFNFREVEEGIQLNLEYCSDLFSKQRIEQLLLHYKSLLKQLLEDTESQIGKIEYLNKTEKERLLIGYNNTTSAFPATMSLVDLFEAQAEKTPDSIAFQFEDISLSYDSLNRLSNQMGHYLNDELAIGIGDSVCVWMDRSEQMMVVLLGILKSGAAYVPIDPEYPQSRVNYILEDTKSGVIITDQQLAKNLKQENYVIISPGDWPVISTFPENNLAIKPSAEDLAYIIYTSGSTGIPKGVMVEHKGVVNRLDWMWRQYNFSQQDVILQKTTYVFDVSVWELFMPLLFGARLVMCRQEVVYDLKQLTACIARYGITAMHFVPSMLQVFLQGLETESPAELISLKRVFCSGEALPVSTVKHFHRKVRAALYNLYGPTEASIEVSHYTTHVEDQKIPIGKPIANMRMYILDENGQLVPEGVLGEIGLAGVGLARGYANLPVLTANSFVHLDLGLEKKERVYLSGDLGYWTTDGMIIYQGRKDRQIKLFGQRLELAEIENVLLKHSSISAARIKLHKEKSKDDFLVAYWVGTSEIASTVLRAYLSDYLPGYMIPSYFVKLEQMPLTKNGKLDESQLRLTEEMMEADKVPYEAPANEIEHQLVELWQQVLQREQVGVEDNFFDVGGNSLRLIIIHQKLQILFPEIKVTDLFKYTTIRALSRFLGAEKDNVAMEGIEV
jgi:tyrocidine synthetase-3